MCGAFTVLSSLAVGVAEMGAACSLLPSSSAVSHSHEAQVLVIATTIALNLIGPGAFSIDARLFGLCEVKIPRISPPSDL